MQAGLRMGMQLQSVTIALWGGDVWERTFEGETSQLHADDYLPLCGFALTLDNLQVQGKR